jgi:hypothetical protein
MGLYTPAMLSYWLGDAVLDVRPGAAEPHCEGGIKLLDQGESVLRAECLYIGTAQAVTHALACGRLPQECLLIVSSGRCGAEMLPMCLR